MRYVRTNARLTVACLLGCASLAVPCFADAPGQLTFVAIQPCRAVDTRVAAGLTGEFGPPALAAGEIRNFQLYASPNCSSTIPSTVKAYAANITVIPVGSLSYLSAWPTGASQPSVSTLNSPLGTVLANAATVMAGTDGAISIYVTDDTELVVDVTGYYADLAGLPGVTGATGTTGVTGPTGAVGATGAPVAPVAPVGPVIPGTPALP